MAQPPHFVFVCDHGVRGGPLERVCLLPWLPDGVGWWPAEGADEHAIGLFAMQGNERGHDPKMANAGIYRSRRT